MRNYFSNFPLKFFFVFGLSLVLWTLIAWPLKNWLQSGFYLDWDMKLTLFSSSPVTFIAAPVYLIWSLIYWMMKKNNRPTDLDLNFYHCLISLGGTMVVFFLNELLFLADNNLFKSIILEHGIVIVSIVFTVWILGQILFLTNIILSLIKRQQPPEKLIGRADILDV